MMSRRFPLLIAISLLFFAFFVGALNFSSFPIINSGETAYTDTNLVCQWSMSGEVPTGINVTWYRNSIYYLSTYDGTGTQTSSTLGSGNTTRDETWTCNVTLFNATANLTRIASKLIENSQPSTEDPGAGVFNDTGTDVGQIIYMLEGETINLDVNATDADAGDTLRYQPADYFCTRTDADLGLYTCTPEHSDILDGVGPAETSTEIEIAFSASDGDLVGGRDITFNITPVNDAPNVSITGQSTPVTDVYNETFTVSDEEQNYPLSTVLNYLATDAEIRDDVTVTIEGNFTVRIIYSTSPIEYGDWGNRTISFNLTDSEGANTVVAFDLEITKVNQPPHFTNISPLNYSSPLNRTYVVNQGETLIINLSSNDADTAERNETIFFSDNSQRLSTVTLISLATNVSDAQGRSTFTPGPLDVGNYTITLFVNDTQGDRSNITLNFTVNNVNDAPIIFNESYNENNTAGNIDITNMLAYINTPFYYEINFTDYDLQFGDTLVWVHNASLAGGFNVSQDGVIGYTPNVVGNETINITVTDSFGASDTIVFTLETLNNSAPYFNDTFVTVPSPCVEGNPCFINLSYYAKDIDSGNNFSSFTALNLTAALGSFSLNTNTGIVNFTPAQSEIGNYTYRITVRDIPGAFATQNLDITIINEEDAPYWDSSANFSSSTIVEDHEFNLILKAYDEDLLLTNTTEQLTITTNISWINITGGSVSDSLFSVLLSFTPNSSLIGTHAIQLNVTDNTNQSALLNFTFTVVANSALPTMNYITPYGNDGSNNVPVYGWLNVATPIKIENDLLRTLENQSYTFQANASDAETSQANLRWTWYYDGAIVRSGVGTSYKSYSYTFLFTESGSHTLTVIVEDATLNTDTFTWNLTVQDVNRAPYLAGDLQTNITVNSVATYQDYFLLLTLGNLKGFFDPDDDIDGSGLIDGSEDQNLIYTSTACSHAEFTFTGEDLTITPVSVGECIVTFNATDSSGLSAISNLIRINVDEVPQGAEVPTSSSSSGGSSSTSNTFIPLPTEVETPKPLTIITPQLVTVYKNRTVVVPIRLKNNWTEPLKGIYIGASTNASGVELGLSSNYVEELGLNETQDLSLTVTGYRLGENFEVTITGNVTEPIFQDDALILFNSIESAEDGEDVEVKVTFAQDLLSQNQECQELNELLLEANARLQEGNLAEAHTMVDLVINGCKYLISKTQEVQRPGVIRTPWLELKDDTVKFISFILLGVFLIIGIAGLIVYHFKTKEEYDF